MHALTACRSCFNFLDNIISCPVWDHESNFSVSYSSEYFSAGTTLVRDNFGELTIGLRFYLLSPKVLCIQLFIIKFFFFFIFTLEYFSLFTRYQTLSTFGQDTTSLLYSTGIQQSARATATTVILNSCTVTQAAVTPVILYCHSTMEFESIRIHCLQC